MENLAYWKAELVSRRRTLEYRRQDLRLGTATNKDIVDCNEAMFEAEEMVEIIERQQNIIFVG